MAHGVHPREQPLQTHACDVALGCAAAQCAESETLQRRRSPMRATGHDCMNCMVLPDGGSGDSWLVGPEGCESVSALRGLPPASGSPSLRGRAKFLYPALSRVNLENVERTPRPQSTWKEGGRRGEGPEASRWQQTPRPMLSNAQRTLRVGPTFFARAFSTSGARSDSPVNRWGSARLGCLKFLVRPSIGVCETVPRRSARRRPKCCISAVSGTLALI